MPLPNIQVTDPDSFFSVESIISQDDEVFLTNIIIPESIIIDSIKELYLILYATHVVDVRKGIRSKKTLLKYSSLTPMERECYEGEVQPYRKTDYKPMIYIKQYLHTQLNMHYH